MDLLKNFDTITKSSGDDKSKDILESINKLFQL